jgi:hypothetical protein
MELWIFDSNNNGYLDVIDNYSSLRWRRKYFEPGEFEIHLPATKENISLLKMGRLVHIFEYKETGIIEFMGINDDDLKISGQMLSCCLDSCYINTTYNFLNQPYGKTMADLVRNHGKMPHCNPFLDVGAIYEGSELLNCQIGIKNLLNILIKLSKTSNIGFKVYLDLKTEKWKFETYLGIDRSINQSLRFPAVFSDDYGNLTGASYTYDISKHKNNALVLGEGEGAERMRVEVDIGKSGDARRYMVVDARDLRKEGMSDNQYRNILHQRGLEKLAEQEVVESFDADAATNIQWKYRTDWDLGDIVTVESVKWGISVNKRITEVEEIFENGVHNIIPTFGTPLPETLEIN